jgi:hypothetical protein
VSVSCKKTKKTKSDPTSPRSNLLGHLRTSLYFSQTSPGLLWRRQFKFKLGDNSNSHWDITLQNICLAGKTVCLLTFSSLAIARMVIPSPGHCLIRCFWNSVRLGILLFNAASAAGIYPTRIKGPTYCVFVRRTSQFEQKQRTRVAHTLQLYLNVFFYN